MEKPEINFPITDGKSLTKTNSSTNEAISTKSNESLTTNTNEYDFIKNLEHSTEQSMCKLDKADNFRIMIYENFSKMNASQKSNMKNSDKNKSKIELRLEENEKSLSNLVWFSDDLVTNIKVRNEKSEFLRKNWENKYYKDLESDLKTETELSLQRYNDINSKWFDLINASEPVHLYEKLEKQKESVFDLMKSKDDIIEQCQKEIKRMSQKYYADQEQQVNDVCCLVERIDIQTDLLKDAYNEHMNLLQNSIEDERQNIAINLTSRWNDFYNAILKHEENKSVITKKKDKFYAEEVNNIRIKQEELTRSTRIRLEKDAELLEWELRIIKNNVLMNSEKLDYNYQVLQKRNEENIIINNQQKRRVAKLNESISSLKKKIQSAKVNTESTMTKLSGDIQKLHSSIKDLEKKSEQFRFNYKIKFYRVWNINYKTILSLLSKVTEIDRILHEQQLCSTWSNADLDLKNILVDDNFSSANNNVNSSKNFSSGRPTIPVDFLQINNLKNIMQSISDRASFLVEDKLLNILEPFSEQQKCLIRLDNIFTALRIRNLKTVSSLSEHFKPYTWCPNCISKNNELMNLKQIVINKNHDFSENTCDNHYLVIEPALVLTALNNFTSTQFKQFGPQGHLKIEKVNQPLIDINNESIIQFWRKFLKYMPTSKQNLWAALQHGLHHYLKVLKIRLELDQECLALERQNDELKYLLQKFQF